MALQHSPYPHLDVEQEGGLGLIQDPLPDLRGHLQSVHAGAVQLLELGGPGDIGESEEGEQIKKDVIYGAGGLVVGAAIKKFAPSFIKSPMGKLAKKIPKVF